MEEYVKPSKAELGNYHETAMICLNIIKKEIMEYRQIEALKEHHARHMSQYTLLDLFVKLDIRTNGCISYEEFSSWLGRDSLNSLTQLQWRALLTRIYAYRVGGERNFEKLLFVDLFDLIFPLEYLGEFELGASSANQHDQNFASLLNRVQMHWTGQPKFTKNTNTSMTESECLPNFKQTTGTLSQNLHDTFGIIELKYEEDIDVDMSVHKYDTQRQLEPSFMGLHPGSNRNHLNTGRGGKKSDFDQNYNSDSHYKKASKLDGLIETAGPHILQGKDLNYASNYSSAQSDKVNCFWHLGPRKSHETVKQITGESSPMYHSRSLTFNRDQDDHRLTLNDYDEIVSKLDYLGGRQIKPRARLLLEAYACEVVFN